MKKIKSFAFLLVPLAFSVNSLADEFSFGAGVGSLYSGVGVNIAMRSDTNLKYLSAGCVSYSDRGGSTCGVGAGWVTTGLFDFQNTQHGLGAYVGVVGTESTIFRKDEAIYGAGFGYHYFFNGIGISGANAGLSFVVGDANSGTHTGLMAQIGYQF
ncbi:MAG: hypothetical protein ABJJ44_20325 [Paraglaciecola sp.]|uniref:hypothetical protein n=1 Tax=Paraglaciecola sp. TaxID=1920173 RepID=UPI00329742AF